MLSNELICSAAAVCHLRQRKESAPFSRHPLVHYFHPLLSFPPSSPSPPSSSPTSALSSPTIIILSTPPSSSPTIYLGHASSALAASILLNYSWLPKKTFLQCARPQLLLLALPGHRSTIPLRDYL